MTVRRPVMSTRGVTLGTSATVTVRRTAAARTGTPGTRRGSQRSSASTTRARSTTSRVAPRQTRRRRGPGRRLTALMGAWSLAFGGMLAQAVRLQISHPEAMVELGKKQRIRATLLAPDRGDLVDRYGVPMAMSVREWRVVADPLAVTDASMVGTKLSGVLSKGAPIQGLDPASLSARIERDGRYVILARGLDEATANATRRLKLDGVALEEEPRRVYPAGDLARSILGRVNRAEQTGVSGLEMRFEKSLQGKPGELLVERNGVGQQIPAGVQHEIPAKRGTSEILTLDRSFQYFVEGALARAMADSGAKSGIVAVSDPKTGDVLALANMRVTDAGEVVNSEHNAALVDVYEPGSVNKVITIAAALEDGVVGPSSTLVVPDRLQVADHKFKDDEDHPYMKWTPGDILAVSSNIGTIKIAQSLKSKRLEIYLRAFGLGTKTGIDFPGESAGILPRYWTGTGKATVPIGQGLAVTALQMLSVYNTLANDGVRVPMRLVRGEIDPKGKQTELPVKGSVRVVSTTTADLVTGMMERVVAEGTGQKAAVVGYRIAGKTGTAQKANLKSLGYQKNAYIASFAGYFPAENPRVSIIAILDEPQTSIYGGVVAAPLFAEVARFAGQHYRIPPSTGTAVVLKDPTTATSDGLSSPELRAVVKSGTWQRASIRRAALGTAIDAATAAAGGATTATISTAPAVTAPPVTAPPITAPPVLRAVPTLPPPGAPSDARSTSSRAVSAPTIPPAPTVSPRPARTVPSTSPPAGGSDAVVATPMTVATTVPRSTIPDISERVRPVVRARAIVKPRSPTTVAPAAGGSDAAPAATAAPAAAAPERAASAPAATSTETPTGAVVAGAAAAASSGATPLVAARPPTTSVEP